MKLLFYNNLMVLTLFIIILISISNILVNRSPNRYQFLNGLAHSI